jgi:hypothetical protein
VKKGWCQIHVCVYVSTVIEISSPVSILYLSVPSSDVEMLLPKANNALVEVLPP